MTYLHILISGIILLSIWSIANITLWLKNVRTVPRGSVEYFQWQMNGLINSVYLLVVFIGLALLSANYSHLKTDFDLRMLTAIAVMASIVISGIFIAFGYWLKKSDKKRSSKQIGSGRSLVYQGVCLLIFLSILSQFLTWTA